MMIKIVPFIIRECLVNLLGYKLGLRGFLGRGKLINITGDVDRDIEDKGIKHRAKVDDILKDLNLKIEKNRFLEMGPGGLLLHGCMIILDGWKEYIAVDAYTSDVWSEYPLSVLQKYSHRLSEDKKRIIKEVIELREKNESVKYYGVNGLFNQDFNDYVGSGGVNLIYSWGVLEHVDDIYSVLKKNYDLLDDNGVAVHVIDTHPHTWLRFTNPYIFLSVPDWLWKLMYGGRGFITRRMPFEYIEAAQKVGFSVTIQNREISICDIGVLKRKFIKRYRELPDEEVLTERVYVVLRK